MTTTTNRPPRVPPVVTLAARDGLERPATPLDCHAMIALEWATHWATIEGRIRPQPGVIIRAALDAYAQHLSALDEPELIQSELATIRRMAHGSGGARALTEARSRIEAAEGRPLAWLDALHSPEARQLTQDIKAAFELLDLKA